MKEFKQTLLRLQKNLDTLRQREARYAGSAPLDLLNQIEDHETAIALTRQVIEGELTEARWRKCLEPLLVHIRDRTTTHPEWGVTIGDVEGGIIGAIIAGRDITAAGDIVTGVKQTASGSNIAQATEGGTATVNVTDQRGQQVEKQYNAGRDIYIHTHESQTPTPAELSVAEQRYRAALKAAFATDADAYIPQTVEATEKTTDPQPRPKLSLRAAQRLRRRAGAEYAKLVQQGQETKRVKLNTLREAVDQYNCIILLGAPGSGKTTSLENLAYQLADESAQVPLPLRLSEFGPGQSLDNFIRRSWGGAATAGYWGEPLLAGQLDTYLADGKLFILFDALNEMPQQWYKQRAADLRRFIDRWTKAGNRFMVTCRVLDYDEELTGLQRVEVLSFSDEQIQTLLQNELPADWETLWAELNEEKRSNHRQPLIELARNPYLLTMMIDVYAVQGELSHDRAELMQRFTTIMLEWAKEKVPSERWITTEAQQQALAALAFEMQVKAGSGARVNVTDVIDALPRKIKRGPAWPSEPTPPDRVLALAASANLIEMPGDRSSIRFYHQLLQEYFSACFIVDNNRYDVLMLHLSDDHWREVFLLTAGMTDKVDDFFRQFRKAIDRLLEWDLVLVGLLRWVNVKSQGVKPPAGQIAALKATYILLARAEVIADDPTIAPSLVEIFKEANLDPEPPSDSVIVSFGHPNLDIALNLINSFFPEAALALDDEFSRVPFIIRPLAEVIELNLGRVLAQAFDNDLALDCQLIKSLHCGFAVEYTRDADIEVYIDDFYVYFEKTAQLAALVAPALATALSELIVPADSAPQSDWRKFNNRLRGLLNEYRDIGYEWDFTEEQINALDTYIKANLLLLECLDVANVTDRGAIKNSLLLPPGEWEF